MPATRWLAVKCKLSKGYFTSERAFEVTLANGETHSGPAPTHFCWNAQGKLLGKNEAVTGEIDGWVAAHALPNKLPGDQVAVEVPDGEAIAVRRSQARETPTEIIPPTPPKVTLELANLGPFSLALEEGDSVAQIVVAMISSPPAQAKALEGVDVGQASVAGTAGKSNKPARKRKKPS